MKTKTVYNEDLHLEHNQWNMELDFWKDELRTFENRLEELVKKWTDTQVLASLDHYQNQFFIHKTKIEELKEKIEAHELSMARHYEVNENAMDRVYFREHILFRERIETQREMYNDLKKDFYKFLTKYM